MTQQTQQKRRVDFDLSQFSGDDRAEMAAMYEETLKNFTEGSIVPGKVLEVVNNEVLVDIGYKSEGIIAADEFEDISKVQPGDQLDVLLAVKAVLVRAYISVHVFLPFGWPVIGSRCGCRSAGDQTRQPGAHAARPQLEQQLERLGKARRDLESAEHFPAGRP